MTLYNDIRTPNVVLYKPFTHKKLNGTFFYSFEYYTYLRLLGVDVHFVLYCDAVDLSFYKNVLNNKYEIDESILDNIHTVDSSFSLMNLHIENALILDDQTYSFTHKTLVFAKNVLTYSEFCHNHLNRTPNHVFYGFYHYQPRNKEYNIKLFSEIHKKAPDSSLKNKTFLSTIKNNMENNIIAKKLNLNPSDLFVKLGNKHNFRMWEEIGKIVYYHTGLVDPCNRIIIESKIHNVPLVVHLNGHLDDSVKHRTDLINSDNESSLFLNDDDLLIKDFSKCCSQTSMNL